MAKVKFKTIKWSTLVKAYDHKPKPAVVYRFSNGKTFVEKKKK